MMSLFDHNSPWQDKNARKALQASQKEDMEKFLYERYSELKTNREKFTKELNREYCSALARQLGPYYPQVKRDLEGGVCREYASGLEEAAKETPTVILESVPEITH